MMAPNRRYELSTEFRTPSGGCHVNDREVKAGTIVETSTENNN